LYFTFLRREAGGLSFGSREVARSQGLKEFNIIVKLTDIERTPE
jgi:hypothetical protein